MYCARHPELTLQHSRAAWRQSQLLGNTMQGMSRIVHAEGCYSQFDWKFNAGYFSHWIMYCILLCVRCIAWLLGVPGISWLSIHVQGCLIDRYQQLWIQPQRKSLRRFLLLYAPDLFKLCRTYWDSYCRQAVCSHEQHYHVGILDTLTYAWWRCINKPRKIMLP